MPTINTLNQDTLWHKRPWHSFAFNRKHHHRNKTAWYLLLTMFRANLHWSTQHQCNSFNCDLWLSCPWKYCQLWVSVAWRETWLILCPLTYLYWINVILTIIAFCGTRQNIYVNIMKNQLFATTMNFLVHFGIESRKMSTQVVDILCIKMLPKIMAHLCLFRRTSSRGGIPLSLFW